MKGYRSWNFDVGSALRVPGGNPVDGLPPARHTETVAKPARPRAAGNGKLTQNFVELARFWWITWIKVRMLKINMELIKYEISNVTTLSLIHI